MKHIRKYITESNLIEDVSDPKEVDQSLHAWEELAKTKELTHRIIQKTQKIITINQKNLRPDQRGYYRSMSKTNVSVGGRAAPDHSMVNDLMNKWLFDVPKMTPLVAHIRFEAIHPFADGNGRTGRMIYWWHCKQLGKEPFLYTAEKREKYYRLFDHDKLIKLSNANWMIEE